MMFTIVLRKQILPVQSSLHMYDNVLIECHFHQGKGVLIGRGVLTEIGVLNKTWRSRESAY